MKIGDLYANEDGEEIRITEVDCNDVMYEYTDDSGDGGCGIDHLAKHFTKIEGPEEVMCPRCKTAGQVRGRRDAYADHVITIDVNESGLPTGSTSWEHTSTAIMDDVVYECFNCNEVLEEEKLASFNNVIL